MNDRARSLRPSTLSLICTAIWPRRLLRAREAPERRVAPLDLTLRALLVLACATLAALSFEPHFLVYNRTASLPRGWYWLSYQKPITRGALILACPPPAPLARIVAAGNPFEPGACPGGYAPLIKVVVGLPGDHIRVLEQGVSINGRIIAHSRPITGLPRPLPLTLPSDEVWGWSPVRGSIDSRYLGPLRPVAVARPLVSFNERERDALVIRFTN